MGGRLLEGRLLCMVSCPTSRFIPVGNVSSNNAFRRLFVDVPSANTYTLGIDDGAVCAGVDS